MRLPDTPANIYHDVEITDIGANGMGIARIDKMVVFVKSTLPGDVVDIRLAIKRRKYLEAIPLQFNRLSPDRTDPVCRHFGICGGCSIRNMDYQAQLRLKQKITQDAFTRIGHFEPIPTLDILPSPHTDYYKNKLEFSFSFNRWLTDTEIASGAAFTDKDALGFHYPGRFDKIVDIQECLMQADPSNAIRLFIKDYAVRNQLTFNNAYKNTGLLRSLIIKTSNTGRTMVTVVFGEEPGKEGLEMLKAIQESPIATDSVYYIVNTKKNDTVYDLEAIHYSGDDHLIEKLGDLELFIGPKSFYQTNSRQAERLYDIVKDFASATTDSVVYDLYSGTGSIGLYLSGGSKKVIGIETIPESIKEAERNKLHNSINNVSFFQGQVEKLLNEDFITSQGKPDIVVFDPPRAGLHKDVIDVINLTMPKRIVYVSCNPSTQARDIALLHPSYSIKKMQAVDMFPHTFHIENVALIELTED